ncbi:MAG: tetratricopeptide repeat protein [Thermoplasmatota archaeon]
MGKQAGGRLLNPKVETSEVKKKPGSLLDLQEDEGCIFCSCETEKDEDTCDACHLHFKPSPLEGLSLPFVLSYISILISFLFLLGEQILVERLELVNSPGDDVGFLFVVLALLSAVLLIIENRGSMFHPGVLKFSTMIFLIPLAAVSSLPLLLGHFSLAAFFFPLIVVSALSIAAALSFKELDRKRLLPLLFMLLGGILCSLGLYLSVEDIGLGWILWFLSGEHFSSAGILVIVTASFVVFSRSSMPERFGSCLLTMVGGSTLILFLGIIRSIHETVGYMDEALMLGSLAMVAVSVGAYLRIKFNEVDMTNSLKGMEESLSKAAELEKDGRYFYALQQYDRALALNPVSGLGRVESRDNVLYRIESGPHVKELVFEPSEYEISYNEKGKILSSQGKFVEASKEYLEAIRKRPDYVESYLNIAMLYASIPGRRNESRNYMRYLLVMKVIYLRRWYRPDLPSFYARWMMKSFRKYHETLEKKSELLNRFSKEGDIWSYYSLARY